MIKISAAGLTALCSEIYFRRRRNHALTDQYMLQQANQNVPQTHIIFDAGAHKPN